MDSTPAECARSRDTTERSDLTGWAGYGYCRSRSRFHWGLHSAWCALPLILADKGYIAVELERIDHYVVITSAPLRLDLDVLVTGCGNEPSD
ncbi:hypothetical protein ACFXDH_06195 [Streptomyces sp. NPDC059467]|uniref:hypothetical protein n=1 Tax=Streptomyces sp. NPDC059467 TaxID=3346844 RepID=UPI0036B31575